jgi:HTH-type transcriptional regulator, glycine betaine synthesis regulator
MVRRTAKNISDTIPGLKPVEAEVIQFFVQFFYALGLPSSNAQIYGYLFLSPVPVTLDDLEARLQMSRGSAFQSLQFLEGLGAVRAVKVPAQRRVHYEAVTELRLLAGNFLRQQIATHLSDSGPRLERISAEAQLLTGEAKAHALRRVKLLKSWNANGRRLLPLLLKVLGGT